MFFFLYFLFSVGFCEGLNGVRPGSGLLRKQSYGEKHPRLAVWLVTLDHIPLSSGKLKLSLPWLNIPSQVCNSSLLEVLQKTPPVCWRWWVVFSGAFQCLVLTCHHTCLCWSVPLQGWQFLVLALVSAMLCQGWLCLQSGLGSGLPQPWTETCPSLAVQNVFCLAAREGWEFGSRYLSDDSLVWCWNLANALRGWEQRFCCLFFSYRTWSRIALDGIVGE